MIPATSGEVTQLATMPHTLLHCTASAEMPTAAKPMMAPTIEWVVDTGQPKILAINNQLPAARSEASMPKTNKSGWLVITSSSTMPLRIVSVTSPPAR